MRKRRTKLSGKAIAEIASNVAPQVVERSIRIGDKEYPAFGGPIQKASGIAAAAVSTRQTFQWNRTAVAGGAVNTLQQSVTFQLTRNARIRKIQTAGFKVDAAGAVGACHVAFGLQGPNIAAVPPVSSGGFVGTVLLFAPSGQYIDVNYDADDSLMLVPNQTYTVFVDLWATFAATDTGFFRFQLQIEYL